MAREARHIDVTNAPELRRLVEEVQRSKQPRVLRRDSEDLAVVVPLTARTAIGRWEQLVEAEIWADVGVGDPGDVWADYDPAAVRAALEQAQGVFDGVEVQELIRDLTEARGQESNGRTD